MEKENVFYKDFYLKELTNVKIMSIFQEDGNNCVIVDKNIFYPQGGGQKGDRGILIYKNTNVIVKNTIKDKYSEGASLLFTETILPQDAEGELVTSILDWDFRYAQMRLHTACHFHHCMLEKVLGKVIKPPKTSDIQEGFVYNRYEENNEIITSEVMEAANKEMRDMISQGAEVITYPDPEKEGYRWWQCLSWKIPCGGTHLANVKEIGNIDITMSRKKGMSTINIRLV